MHLLTLTYVFRVCVSFAQGKPIDRKDGFGGGFDSIKEGIEKRSKDDWGGNGTGGASGKLGGGSVTSFEEYMKKRAAEAGGKVLQHVGWLQCFAAILPTTLPCFFLFHATLRANATASPLPFSERCYIHGFTVAFFGTLHLVAFAYIPADATLPPRLPPSGFPSSLFLFPLLVSVWLVFCHPPFPSLSSLSSLSHCLLWGYVCMPNR